jgi:hypothetical protein
VQLGTPHVVEMGIWKPPLLDDGVSDGSVESIDAEGVFDGVELIEGVSEIIKLLVLDVLAIDEFDN